MSQKDVMTSIAAANKSVVSGAEQGDSKYMVKIYVVGKEYEVPAHLTIMQAMEYVGYRFVRSAGCRAGFCGACSTMYVMRNDYKLKFAMACQCRVEDGMYLVQLPVMPVPKSRYDIDSESYTSNVFTKYYPEIARCLCCSSCTRACPQELEVMDYVQAALRGDFEKVAELSFDCIQCGLCAIRCPAEIVQYNVAQLGRRMYGKYGFKSEPNVTGRVKEIEDGKFDKEFEKLSSLSSDELKSVYAEQQKMKESL